MKIDWAQGQMQGFGVQQSEKRFQSLAFLYRDQEAASRVDPERVIYRVQWWTEAPSGSPGGLYWGVTVLEPGKVCDEYYMTHGHYHADRSRAEFYATVRGSGALLLMDENRETKCEAMSSGSLHYINGEFAHRVVNTGDEPLVFWACWGTDAGYEYGTIAQQGFSARLVERNRTATLVRND